MFRFLFLLIDLRSRAIIWSPFRSCLRWNLRCCNGLTLNWSLRLLETFFRTINLSVPQGESFSLSTTSFWSTLLLYLLCSEYTSTKFFPQTFSSFFFAMRKKKKNLYYLTPMFGQSLYRSPSINSSPIQWMEHTLKALQTAESPTNPTACSFSSQIFNLWVFFKPADWKYVGLIRIIVLW